VSSYKNQLFPLAKNLKMNKIPQIELYSEAHFYIKEFFVKNYKALDNLTSRGLMLPRLFGNGSPSLNQLVLAQSLVDLIAENKEMSAKLDSLILSASTLSRSAIQLDSQYYRQEN
jgi:hypothetical protein